MNFSKKAAVMALTASALPYVVSATEINWSEISDIIEGAATVFGSVEH